MQGRADISAAIDSASRIPQIANGVMAQAVGYGPSSGDYDLDDEILGVEYPNSRPDQRVAISEGFDLGHGFHMFRLARIGICHS